MKWMPDVLPLGIKWSKREAGRSHVELRFMFVEVYLDFHDEVSYAWYVGTRETLI
jgi:hypothetical protein